MVAAAGRSVTDAPANSVDEVVERAAGLGFGWPRLTILAEPCLVTGVLSVERHITATAVEHIANDVPVLLAILRLADAGLAIGDPVPKFEDQRFLATVVVEVENSGHRVRRFLVIIEHIVAAHRAHFRRERHAESPT